MTPLLAYLDTIRARLENPSGYAPDHVAITMLCDLDRLERLARAAEELTEYVTHEDDCTSAQWTAGEPTPDGGYRSKYAGQWYARGEAVPCECGLRDKVARWEAISEEVARED